MQNVKARRAIERRIIGMAVKDILKAGYSISVHDGEEIALSRSVKKSDIMKAIMSTDEDVLIIYNQDKTRLGAIYCVYGNGGWDVIADYSVSLKYLLSNVNKYSMNEGTL